MNKEDLSLFEQLSKERKELQEQGNLPEWFTTMGWQMFKNKYLFKANSYEEQIDRIVRVMGKHCPSKTEYFKSRWKELLIKNHAYLSTPVLANAGTTRGNIVSCQGSYVSNSIDGFYSSLHEQALLTKYGFGVSAYFGDVSERGTDLDEGMKASGTLPVFKQFVQMSKDVSQGSRRGAFAGYLPLEHGDFWEIVNYLRNNPDSMNVGWNIYDSTLKDLLAGSDDINERFAKSLHTKLLQGKGYYYFPDKVNRASPQMYKDHGLSSKASNLCVVPETPILTREGYIPIAEAEGKKLDVWNGKEWSLVNIIKTSDNEDIFKVITSSGQELECTEYHKFYVQDSYKSEPYVKRTHELKEGDKLIKFELPIVQGKYSMDKAYQNGFFSGDGCLVRGKGRVYLYADKKHLLKKFNLTNIVDQPELGRIYGNEGGLKDKFFVPSAFYNVESRLGWFAGLADADGTIARNGDNESLQIASIHKEFLKEIQLMLQTLGVSSKVTQVREQGNHLLPANDGSGELKEYSCKSLYRLLLSSSALFKLSQLGFKCERLSWQIRRPQRDAEQFIKVKQVINEGRQSPTYCFKEYKRGMGMFSGLLTGQCTEITLHSDENHTYSCVLSGMVATTWDEWKDTDAVFCMTVFLDCMVSEFLELARGKKGLEKIVRGTEKGRAIGLGLTGLHSLFQIKMLPFGSLEAHWLNDDIFKHLQDESLKASEWMATQWGEPEWCEGYGVRNTHRTALAPNVSSALIFGSQSQGITPWYGNCFNEGSAAGGMFRVNPVFIDMLKAKGKYSDKILQHVLEKAGSAQDLDFLTDEERSVMLTAFEINQRDLLRLAGARQKYICQSQSLNLFFSENEQEEYIAEIHKEAFLDENIHSLYYLRGKAGVEASKGECTACQS